MTVALVEYEKAGELQHAINNAHANVQRHGESMVQYAVQCGSLLIDAKGDVSHGEWAQWVEDNFNGSAWVARKYMQLARVEQASEGSITRMESIGEALRSIATPRRPQIEAPKPKPPPDLSATKLVGIAKAAGREAERDATDTDSVEIAPVGVEERRWNAALSRWEETRCRMTEAVTPGLTSDASASALQEASIAARQTAIELEQMASARRRAS